MGRLEDCETKIQALEEKLRRLQGGFEAFTGIADSGDISADNVFLQGNTNLLNNTGYRAFDTGGLARNLLSLGPDNVTNVSAGATNGTVAFLDKDGTQIGKMALNLFYTAYAAQIHQEIYENGSVAAAGTWAVRALGTNTSAFLIVAEAEATGGNRRIMLAIYSAGAVTLISNPDATWAIISTAGKLCLYLSAGNLLFENRLAGASAGQNIMLFGKG